MGLPNRTYVVNDKGERVGVLLDIEEYQKMIEVLEELDEIRAYDAAMASNDDAIPFEQAVEEIEHAM